MNPTLSPQAVLNDPAASSWIKHALCAALTRDVVDAAADAEYLAAVLKARAEDTLKVFNGRTA